MRWWRGLVCGVEGEGEACEEGEGAGEEEAGEGVVGRVGGWEGGDFPGAGDAAAVEDEVDAVIQVCLPRRHSHILGWGDCFFIFVSSIVELGCTSLSLL